MRLVVIFFYLFCFVLHAEDEINNSLQQTVYNIYRKDGEFGKKGLFRIFSDKDEFLNISTNANDFSRPVLKINRLKLIEDRHELLFEEFMKDNLKKFEKNDMGRGHHDKFNFLLFGPQYKEVFIEFQNFNKDVIEFKYKDKTLYLKFPSSPYDDTGKVTDWFFYSNLFGKTGQQAELDKELEKYPDFKKLIFDLRKCVAKKSEDCFAKYIGEGSTSHTELVQIFKNDLMRRYLRDDPKTCPRYPYAYREGNGALIPVELKTQVDRTQSTVWDSMEKALSVNIKYNFIDITSDNFNDGINTILVFKKPSKNLSCNNSIDVKFYFKKINGKWSLEQFEFSDDEEEYGC